jgi:very-short-patch-repair endonuclease
MTTDMFYGAPPIIFSRAKQLRSQLTPAEACLWDALRANKLFGFRFKLQHPLNNFIADFYCHSAKLVIELDGSIHDEEEQKDWDTNRTAMLEEFGINVLRFQNNDVLTDIDGVLAKIKQHLLRVD